MERPADSKVPLVDVRLDDAQRRAVRLPAGRALLVLGEAGHGKTTVAIHRAAHLARGAKGRLRAVAVLPTEGLRALVERGFVRLGAGVTALTYDRFARRQARRCFPGVPREGTDATPAVVRFKRHPALALALDVLAARAAGVIDDDPDAPPDPANVSIGDLQHLFGDRELLERVRAGANGHLPAHAVAEVLEHTRIQFHPTSEDAFSYVTERRRLIPVDGLSLDAGTPDADAATVDPEDYAVLFEIDRRRALRRGLVPARPRAYDCLVLDEAQELAPFELALVGRCLARGASLVVAGDADQQIDDRACFAGWDATMRALGAPDYERVVLDVGYRCAEPVARLARHVRTPAEHAAPHADVSSFPTEAALADWLVGVLEGLQRSPPRASIAVIARAPLTARRIVRRIRDAMPARLVLDGAFSHAPGVDVTTIDQVRGLEFDHVVVPDASATVYGAEAASRAALYVAITRARRSVACACVGRATALV